MSDPQYARDPSSLISIVSQFEQEGFTGQLAVREQASLLCLSCHQEHPAAEFEMSALRRTEGASDPADMAAVVALTCPHCSAQGTVVLKFGPEASPEESDVLLALEDQRQGDGVIVDPSESPDRTTTAETAPGDTGT
jgi:hypothetical protein